MRLLTKSGKPVINSNTKLPVYTSTVEYRIKQAKSQLGLNSLNKQDKFDAIWSNITNQVKHL